MISEAFFIIYILLFYCKVNLYPNVTVKKLFLEL